MDKLFLVLRVSCMNKTNLLLLTLILVSCSNNPSPHASEQNASNVIDSSRIGPDFIDLTIRHDSVSMLSRGHFQGTDLSDSTGPYVSREVYLDKNAFEIVYLPKSGSKNDLSLQTVMKVRTKAFEEFNCLIFQYAMRNPEKQDDYHADHVSYPVEISFYTRKNQNWILRSKSTVHNMAELTRFRIRSIYDNLK